MKYCPHCGKLNSSSAGRTCTSCGKSLEVGFASLPSVPQRPQKRVVDLRKDAEDDDDDSSDAEYVPSLTELGRANANIISEHDTNVKPAPVKLGEILKQQ